MIPQSFFPRFPQAAWEGWFAIFIAPAGSPLRWAKTHIFRSRCRYPLAAAEGLHAPGELLTMLGFNDRIETIVTAFSPWDLQTREEEPFGLVLDAAVHWRVGAVASLARQANGMRLDQRIDLTDRLDWIRIPRLLTYLGYQGGSELTLQRGDESLRTEGLGIIEHAWGAAAPLNPVSLIPGRWHWDVVFFEAEPTFPIASAAFLWLPLPHKPRGVRGFARIPGREFIRAHPLELGYTAVQHLDGGGRTPRTWRAEVRIENGVFAYEAVASTPAVACAPGGGFLGFRFEGTFRPDHGPPRRLLGTGFCECGGPQGG